MNSSVFMMTLRILSTYAEIHASITKGGISNDELLTAQAKLEVAMAQMINKLLETEGQVV